MNFQKISYFFYKPASSKMSIMICLVRSAKNMLVIINYILVSARLMSEELHLIAITLS